MSAELVITLVNRSVSTQMVPTPVSVGVAMSLGGTSIDVKVDK